MLQNLSNKINTYAFGSLKNGRNFSVGSGYKYGMNTQQKDDEVFVGTYTAEFWEYDSRLGRRWNLDPKYNSEESRYLVNGCNPVYFTDPLGDFKHKFGAILYNLTHKGKGAVSQAKDINHKGEWFVTSGRGNNLTRIFDSNKERTYLSFEKDSRKSEIEEYFNWKFEPKIYTGSNLFNHTLYHYQFGEQMPLHISINSIDFKGVSKKNLKSLGNKRYGLDFYKIQPYSQTSLALGKISLKSIGNNEYIVEKDVYDFNIEWNKGITKRNVATFFAGTIHNISLLPLMLDGGSFDIITHGSVKIK